MNEQPLALHDAHGRLIDYLRVSVTDRCNHRCTYCMPEDGVSHADKADVLSFEEIVALVAVFVDLGVRRVRITGGEPTVRKDVATLVAMLARLPKLQDLSLSTNGQRLAELAEPLRAAGLRRLNVSLDSLDPVRFAAITRRGDLQEVLAGLRAAHAAGFSVIKLNTVAIKGFNDDEIVALCRFAWAEGFLPRFIEQMPMTDGRLFVPGRLLSAAEVRQAVLRGFPGAVLSAEPEAGERGGGPARYHGVHTAQGQLIGRFGLISPMTEHFCDTCNRVRLSSSGALHLCLADDQAIDLRRALHQGGPGAVANTILAALSGKKPSHLFQISGTGGPRKSMVQIGG